MRVRLAFFSLARSGAVCAFAALMLVSAPVAAQSPLSEGGYYYAQYRYSYGRHDPKRKGFFARLVSRRKTRH